MSLLPKLQMTEEELVYAVLRIERSDMGDWEQNVVHRILQDRNYLLLRMKLIIEALEARDNLDEITKWAREGYDEICLG